MELRKFIATTIREYLNDNIGDNSDILTENSLIKYILHNILMYKVKGIIFSTKIKEYY